MDRARKELELELLEWQAKSAGCQTGSPGIETQKKKTKPADPPEKRKKIPYRQ